MADVIHVLVADDHEMVREGIKSSLRPHEDLSVVGEARDGLQAVQQAIRLKPELVIMDIRMPKMSGIEACREIRNELPQTNVLILTSYGDERAVMSAIMAGAGGFILKEVSAGTLLDAIRTVGGGGNTLDPTSAATVMAKIRQGQVMSDEDRLAQQLSERELEIIDLIADGLTNREIGERLFLAEKTVKHYVSDILGKLGITRRVEAATFAIRRAAQRPPEASGS